MVRQDHPTIDNSKLALELLDKFSGLWEEPRLDEVRNHNRSILTTGRITEAALVPLRPGI